MKARPLYFTIAFLLLASFFVIFFVFKSFGGKYDQGLASLLQKTQDPPATRKVRSVRKITVIHEGENGCIEVTPDGVVRTYNNCGGELTDANRLADPKNVLRLIQSMSQIDLAQYRKKVSGPVLTLIIETDTGTETIYIPTGGGGNDIVETITKIEGDLPQPTSTPGPYIETPTPTLGGVSSSPTPTPLVSPTLGPSPTPTPTGNPDNPFRCGYTQNGSTQKPFNVSNYICSTEPSPAP